MDIAEIKISSYMARAAAGADISNPDAGGGYDAGLVRELARVVSSGGGMVQLTAPGLRELAAWLDSLEAVAAGRGDVAHAAALKRTADNARALVWLLED